MPYLALAVIASVFFLSTAVLASQETGNTMNWNHMAMGLFGGLALFLYGMEQMSGALKSALGDQMRVLLAKLTRNRFSGALTGAFVTAVIQSSSVTTVLVVGFVSAGMMTMAQSIGVIMGANVGTTITAQIVAFKVEEAALWMIAAGFLMMFISRQERIKHYGNMIMGLGLIFYGMGLMGDAMRPLRSYEPFLDLMIRMNNPFLAIVSGALFTALVQSSSATTAIVITMAGQGLISLEAGIALALGSNIGTCITAQLAALGKPREAIRAAVVHLIFNVSGAVIWVPFITLLASWVVSISPSHPELEGTARLAAEVPRQIANAHTLFNSANTIIFIGLTGVLARLVERLVPDRPDPEKIIIRPQFLDDSLLDTPSMALERVRLEIARMGEIVHQMFSDARTGVLHRNRAHLKSVQKTDDKVNILDGEIIRYLSAIKKQTLTEKQRAFFPIAMKTADNIESIGDIISSELIRVGYRMIDLDIKASETMRHLLNELIERLETALEKTICGLRDHDEIAAAEVLRMQDDINRLVDQALDIQSANLADFGSEQVEIIRIEMTILENLRRIHTHLRRIAQAIVPPEVLFQE